MFADCRDIIEIDLSKFETSNVTDMKSMFYGCSSLASLNLSNINTSRVTTMANMFHYCSKLASLDLSYFDISQVISISEMFLECNNLEFINFKHLKLIDNMTKTFAFNTNNNKLIICSENRDNALLTLFHKNIDINCKNYESINKNTCYSMESTFDYKFICDICGKNYNKINIYNNGQNDNYTNCFAEIEEYYSDTIDLGYKTCYISFKVCKTDGNEDTHNCVECKEEYKYEINIPNSNYNNCYTIDQYNKLEISTYNYEPQSIYNEDKSFEIIKTEKNIFETILIYHNYSSLVSKIISKSNNNINEPNNIILSIINELFTTINISYINDGNDKKINLENEQIILTTTTNQKNNEDKNDITMDLGQCENILKNHYNNSLYILQIISEEKEMKIPKLEYEIYYPLNNDNELIKLNLSYCRDTKIDISISVKIDGQLDKYNSSSDYYNNICYKTTSESGTDISLNDRRNEFVNNNLSLCEENCELIDYDYIKEKVKCSCDIKTSISSYDDIKFDKNDFFKSFIDIKNIMNINILKCYKTVLKIKDLKKNYGFFSWLCYYFLFYCIVFFYYQI